MAGFGFSKWYGIIGVFVVAGITIVIASTVDPTNAKPKLQYGLIFGVIALYLIGLFFFQSRDLSKVEGDSKRKTARAEASGPSDVDDPTGMDEADLWASMAVKPIDREASQARDEMWAPARRSMHLAMLVCLLILLAVPPIYLFDTFVPLMIGAPLIFLLAVWGSIRAIGSGGEVDQAFDRTDVMMKPLGLHLVERPSIQMQPRFGMFGANARLVGPMLLEGSRHGRSVSVNQEGNTSVTTVKGSVPSFEAKASGGRLKAGDDADEKVTAALEKIPGSWKGVKVQGSRGGVSVERKGHRGDWLQDLWLAEEIAGRL